MSEIIIIIISLTIITLTYIFVSKKEGSFINVLTPLFSTLFARCILELIYYHSFGISGSLFSFFYVYATNTIDFACFSLSYLLFPKNIIRIRIFETVNQFNHISLTPYFFILLSFLLYLPIIIEYHEFIFSPREIYMSTRKGYGFSFFLSSTILYLSIIIFLFKRPSFKGERLIAGLIILILLLLHGSKGHILLVLFIIIFYNIYIIGRKVNFKSFIKWSFCICAVILALFYTSFREQQREELLLSIAIFSSYDRNAMMVIDSNIEPQFGRLTMENELYCRLPRPLFPDKPKDYGTFYLAKIFYPAWFELEQGSPAFGYGTQYADFNLLSIFFISIFSIISGVALKISKNRVILFKNIGDFILLIFFSGISLIPIGTGFLLPEHFMLSIIVVYSMKIGNELDKILVNTRKNYEKESR